MKNLNYLNDLNVGWGHAGLGWESMQVALGRGHPVASLGSLGLWSPAPKAFWLSDCIVDLAPLNLFKGVFYTGNVFHVYVSAS